MKKLRVRISLFLCLEIFLYLTFFHYDINNGILSNVTNIIKYLSLFICFLFSLWEGIQRHYFSPLTLSLACAAIADVFLLFTQYFSIGILFFICVQTCYRYVLSGKKRILPMYILCTIMATISFPAMKMFNMKPDIISILVVFYLSFLLVNVITSCTKAIFSKQAWMWALALGIVLLLLCDLNVGLYNMRSYIGFSKYPSLSPLLEFSPTAMWLFYLPSQVLIALLSLRNEHGSSCILDTN